MDRAEWLYKGCSALFYYSKNGSMVPISCPVLRLLVGVTEGAISQCRLAQCGQLKDKP